VRTSIVIGYCDNYQELARVALPNHLEYCLRYGYQLIIGKYRDPIQGNLETLWKERMPFLRTALQMSDLVLWLGLDTIITNMTITVESIFEKYKPADIIIGVDVNGINNDSVFIRNCKDSFDFIDFIINNFQCNDQYMMSHAFNTMKQLKFKMIPQKEINAYLYDRFYGFKDKDGHPRREGQWTKGDYIIHTPALPLGIRIEVAKEKMLEVVR